MTKAEKPYNPEIMIVNPNSALFFLGEPFRLSMLGEDTGEENDEDSIVNDLDYYLGNYEADWVGLGLNTVLEHYGWEHLSQVIWVRRNSAKTREAWVEEPGERNLSQVIYLPKETNDENACWIVKAMMRSK